MLTNEPAPRGLLAQNIEAYSRYFRANEELTEYIQIAAAALELPINQIVDERGQPFLRLISPEKIAELGLKPELRPDIFLYPEEGQCVLVELKAPEVSLAEHLNQMTKYCNLIANYSIRKIKKFYCYLIGETINPLTDLPGTYEETVSGDWISQNEPVRTIDRERRTIGTLQIEISRLSSIYTRAYRRNKSFADKLGLRELLIEPARATTTTWTSLEEEPLSLIGMPRGP